MTLKQWLKEERRSMEWLAKELGYKGAATVCHWINGKISPSIENVQAIDRLTNGKVKFADWMENKE